MKKEEKTKKDEVGDDDDDDDDDDDSKDDDGDEDDNDDDDDNDDTDEEGKHEEKRDGVKNGGVGDNGLILLHSLFFDSSTYYKTIAGLLYTASTTPKIWADYQGCHYQIHFAFITLLFGHWAAYRFGRKWCLK